MTYDPPPKYTVIDFCGGIMASDMAKIASKNSYESRKKNHKRDLKPRFEPDLKIYDVDIVLHLSLIPLFWISKLISSSNKWALS